jgi:hypothetical protein
VLDKFQNQLRKLHSKPETPAMLLFSVENHVAFWQNLKINFYEFDVLGKKISLVIVLYGKKKSGKFGQLLIFHLPKNLVK